MDRYSEIMEELEYVTDHDGFVETCLDLRDSMYFYDKGLILAGYASSVEMMMSFAMFWAALEAPEESPEVFDRIEDIIYNLEDRLRDDDVTMDVAALIETFLQTSGWVLSQRFVVFRHMFEAYRDSRYNLEENPDKLLREAQTLVEKDNHRAAELVGQVGAMALRGAAIRPVWLLIAKPRLQMWLRGVLGVAQNFAAASHFSFPVDAADRERQKWRPDTGKPVVDLKAFRNLRYPMMPSDIPSILRREEIDDDLLELFVGGPLHQEAAARLKAAGDSVKDVLLAVLATEELFEEREASIGSQWVLTNVLEILSKLEEPETISVLLDLLCRIPQGEALYLQVLEFLLNYKEEAAEAAAAKLKGERLSVEEALAVTDFLSRVRPAEVYPVLVRLLDKVDTWDEQLAVARSLIQTGDVRAVPHLRRLGTALADSPYSKIAQEFLAYAARQMKNGSRGSRRVLGKVREMRQANGCSRPRAKVGRTSSGGRSGRRM